MFVSRIRIAVWIFLCVSQQGLWAADPIIGKWLKHHSTADVKMDETAGGEFGGWQTSDLTYDALSHTWWSISDQNGREGANHSTPERSHRGRYLYRFHELAPNAEAVPIPIWWERKEPDFDMVDKSFHGTGTGFIDFEGIAADPTVPNRLIACTEGPEPWLVEIEVSGTDKKAVVTRSVRISTQGNHDQDRFGRRVSADPNKRWEGITFSHDGKTIYLATEWVDSPARVYTVPTADFRKGSWERNVNGEWSPPKVFPTPLIKAGIEGELTGLCVVAHGNKHKLLVLERNTPQKSLPPAVYVFDLANPDAPLARISLDFRAPAKNGRAEGIRIRSASPEGIASDGARLVFISDPVGAFYKPLDAAANNERFVDLGRLQNLIPLVFEAEVVKIIGP